jgi:hypothetical protein
MVQDTPVPASAMHVPLVQKDTITKKAASSEGIEHGKKEGARRTAGGAISVVTVSQVRNNEEAT